ncbi:hypothetical protein BLX88_26500, partial [Bacillus obstructivus]
CVVVLCFFFKQKTAYDVSARDEGRVHAVHGIAHAHGRGGVPVVAAADREESAAAGPPARRLVLEGELERALPP